ncbi:hypothetical protein ScPMuIL_000132 [Solemya velum]
MDTCKPRPHPVDRGYAWVILIGCFTMYMLLVGGIKTYGILYTEFIDHFQTGAGDTAWIGSVCLFILFILGPFVNFLSRKTSFRAVTFTAGLLVCLGYVTSAFVERMQLMYLTFGILGGIGYGFGFAPCSTIVSFYFNKHRALANGITVSGSGVGAFLFPFLYRYLIDEYGLQGGMILIGGLMLNVCVAACLFRQPVLATQGGNGSDDTPTPDHDPISTVKTNIPADTRLLINTDIPKNKISKSQKSAKKKKCCIGLNFECSLFKTPRFSMWVIAFCLCMTGYSANSTMIPAHVQALGYGKDKVALAMSILGISELFARIFMGWLADRKLFPRKYIFIVSMLVSGVAAILLPFFSSFVVMVIYCVIIGIFPGSFFSLISIFIIESVGIEKLSAGFGLVSVSMAIGAALSQPIVGWLEDATGNWDMSFRFAGLLKLLAGLVVLCEPLILKIFGEKPMPETNGEHIPNPDSIELDIAKPMMENAEQSEDN